jgi:drug/metabolite transporter (DMT)-like permease
LHSKSTGRLFISVAAIIWGSNGVIVNWVPLPSYVIAFFRVSLAASSLILVVLFTRSWRLVKVLHAWRSLLVLGILLSLGWVLLFQSMKMIPIGNAVLLNYTAPIFVALLSPILLEERLERSTILALILSMVGILLISSSQGLRIRGLDLLGLIIGVMSGLFYAVFIVFSKRALTNLPSYSVALYSYLTSSAFLAPSLIKVEISLDSGFWFLLLFLGVFNTAFATTLYFKGLRLIKAQEAAVLTYLEALSAVAFGYLLLAQQPALSTIVGGLLILSAGYIVTSRRG